MKIFDCKGLKLKYKKYIYNVKKIVWLIVKVGLMSN